MERSYVVFLLLCLSAACHSQSEQEQKPDYRLVGSCEGCEAVFEYGTRTLGAVDTLPDFGKYEPRLKLTGTIYKSDGETPAPNVILYIYHTDEKGIYPAKGDELGWAKRHGYIRGWIKTDSSGKYTFYTFKPGSYGSNPAHIHATILEPDGKFYYISDYNFEGDPALKKNRNEKERGGSGLIVLQKEDGLFVAERHIVLGLYVQGYD